MVLHLLKRVGLNEYESKAYSALLQLGSATAAEVSKRAGIPRARVYDVLVGLEKKGFLSQEIARPIRFKAFHPETALANLEKAKRKGFETELALLSQLKASLAKHADSIKKKAQETGESVLLLSGKANIHAKVEELLKTSTQEAIISTNAANAVKKAGFLKRIMEGQSNIAVPVSFYSSSTIDLKKEFPELEKVVFQKSENAGRFMVFDAKTALLFLSHEPNDNEKALLIESPHIAGYLKQSIR